MIKLHLSYLYTKKIISITYIILLITGFFCFLFSKLYLGHQELLINHIVYKDSYIFDSLSTIKIIMVVYIMFTTIYSFVLNQYDGFLITRSTRKIIISSKIISQVTINLLFGYIIILTFLVIWLITPYIINFTIIIKLFYVFTLFITFYTILSIFLIITFRQLYVLIIPVVGFFVTTFSIDYGSSINEISHFTKLIIFLFPDFIYSSKTFHYVYSEMFYLSAILLLFLNTIVKYNECDIKV